MPETFEQVRLFFTMLAGTLTLILAFQRAWQWTREWRLEIIYTADPSAITRGPKEWPPPLEDDLAEGVGFAGFTSPVEPDGAAFQYREDGAVIQPMAAPPEFGGELPEWWKEAHDG